MTKIDTYKHLDKESFYNLRVELNPEQVAKEFCHLNYGAHRLLSAMVHELRKKRLEEIAYYDERDKDKPVEQRLAFTKEEKRSPLADAIEAALNSGHTN